MRITVDQTFDSDHRVVNQLGQSSGKFTFTSAESGEHKLCFTPSSASYGGWLSQGQPLGGLKLTVDLAIGETSQIESADKGKIQDIVGKVKELNGRLQDIRREQVFQRVSRLIRSCSVLDYHIAAISDSVVCVCRSGKQSFEINQRVRTQGW